MYLLNLGNRVFLKSMFICVGIGKEGREILRSVSSESASMYLHRTAFVV